MALIHRRKEPHLLYVYKRCNKQLKWFLKQPGQEDKVLPPSSRGLKYIHEASSHQKKLCNFFKNHFRTNQSPNNSHPSKSFFNTTIRMITQTKSVNHQDCVTGWSLLQIDFCQICSFIQINGIEAVATAAWRRVLMLHNVRPLWRLLTIKPAA